MKISKAEFTRRRKKLMGMMDRHSIAIIPGAREVTRSRDTEYAFRQDSDLFSLTGFEEPDAVLVLVPGRRQGQVVLFCRERDPEMELWNGYRLGPEGAVAYLGIDDAFPIDDLDDILPGLIEGTQRIYYSMGHDDVFAGFRVDVILGQDFFALGLGFFELFEKHVGVGDVKVPTRVFLFGLAENIAVTQRNRCLWIIVWHVHYVIDAKNIHREALKTVCQFA